MPATVQYHVTLGGQGLVLDMETYEKRVQAPFADKTSQGDRTYGDLSFEQVWELTDWSGGDELGQALQHEPERPDRFRTGQHIDPYSVRGSARVGPALNTSYASAESGFLTLCPFNGRIFAGSQDGDIYACTFPDTWASSRATGHAGGITALCVYSGRLYAANGTEGGVDSYDGSAWSADSFIAASAAGIRSMCVRDPIAPTLYVGVSKTAPSGAEIKRYNGTSLSAVLYLLQEPDCLAMVEYGGYLWMFGADTATIRGGIYRTDATNFERRVDLPDCYVTSAVVFDDRIFLGMSNGELWSWDGDGSPVVVGRDLFPSGDALWGLAQWKGALWIAGRSTTEARLRRLDADGSWSTPAAGGTVTNAVNAVRQLASANGDLYLATVDTTPGSDIYRLRSTVYPTAAKTLETRLFSANLGSDYKVFRSVTINHAALAASQSIQVQYQLEDTGAWTSLGTNSSVGSTSATYTFSAGIKGKLIGLRLILTATASATPALYQVLLRYALQPTTKREWVFEALFEGSADLPLILLNGTASPQTGPQIAQVVWVAKAADGPLTYVDDDGASYSVWFVELVEGISQRSQRRGGAMRGRLRLLEA